MNKERVLAMILANKKALVVGFSTVVGALLGAVAGVAISKENVTFDVGDNTDPTSAD